MPDPVSTIVQGGELMPYTPASDVAAGAIVAVGKTLGVAVVPIPANTLGNLSVNCVAKLPKPTGAGTAVGQGEDVYFSNSQAVTGVTGFKAGKCFAAATATDNTVDVWLNR
jgi:predicted RecA/RadA family phage recombinase